MPNPPKKPATAATKPSSPSLSTGKTNTLSALHKAEDNVKKATANTERTPGIAAKAGISATTANESMARTAKENTENVVRLGTGTMQNLLESGQAQTQKMKEETSKYAQAGAQQFSAQAGKASRAMGEMASIGQSQMEALKECGTIAAAFSKELSEELFNYTNAAFSSNVEISKDLFSCRTISDMFDLQNKMIKSNLDRFFSESSKISEMVFNSMNQASEPLNECMQAASERLSRSMAA